MIFAKGEVARSYQVLEAFQKEYSESPEAEQASLLLQKCKSEFEAEILPVWEKRKEAFCQYLVKFICF